jgi:hypothetical protein
VMLKPGPCTRVTVVSSLVTRSLILVTFGLYLINYLFIYDFCSGAVSNPGCIAIKCYDARFDVSILVTVKISVVWDVTLCSHMCMDVSEERAVSISWWKKKLS